MRRIELSIFINFCNLISLPYEMFFFGNIRNSVIFRILVLTSFTGKYLFQCSPPEIIVIKDFRMRNR